MNKMDLIGICLLAAAIAGLFAAKPRGGVVKIRNPFMQVVTAVGITATAALGWVFIGFGRF